MNDVLNGTQMPSLLMNIRPTIIIRVLRNAWEGLNVQWRVAMRNTSISVELQRANHSDMLTRLHNSLVLPASCFIS